MRIGFIPTNHTHTHARTACYSNPLFNDPFAVDYVAGLAADNDYSDEDDDDDEAGLGTSVRVPVGSFSTT